MFVIQVRALGSCDNLPNYVEPVFFTNIQEAMDYVPKILDELRDTYGNFEEDNVDDEYIVNKIDKIDLSNKDNRFFEYVCLSFENGSVNIDIIYLEEYMSRDEEKG